MDNEVDVELVGVGVPASWGVGAGLGPLHVFREFEAFGPRDGKRKHARVLVGEVDANVLGGAFADQAGQVFATESDADHVGRELADADDLCDARRGALAARGRRLG